MEWLKFLIFGLSHYAFFLLMGVLSYGIGRRFLFRSRFAHPLEQFCFCATLGLGILSHLILLIGTLGVLYQWLVLIVIGLLFWLCYDVWVELFKGLRLLQQRQIVHRQSVVFVSLAFFALLPVFLLPLYPPTSFDPTMYHLPYAKIYTQANQIVVTPFLRYAVFPQTNEMLFTLAYLLYDDIAAQLMQFLMMCILGIALYVFGWRHFSHRSGIWAVAVLLSNPMVIYMGSIGNIDIGLTLFITMSLLGIFNYFDAKEKRWLVLAALFLGWSAGSKYSALFFVLLFGSMLLYLGWKNRALFSFSFFLFIAVGIAFPWYFRNWYYTGNPVYPFFGQWFGYSFWTPQDLQGQLEFLINTFGTGKNLSSFLLLPWNLAVNQKLFGIEAYYSPIYLMALPFVFMSFPGSKFIALSVIILSYTLFWFNTSQILRFLLPIVPVVSLLVAVALENGLNFKIFKKTDWFNKRYFMVVVSILIFSPGWLYALHKLNRQGFLPPYTRDRQEKYLANQRPSYPAYQFLNKKKGQNYVLYALYDENMAYFADGQFMGDWFGPAHFGKISRHLSNPELLQKELRSLGANYFLIRRGRVEIPSFQKEGFVSPYFNLVYENEHCLLFEVLN